MAVIWRYLGPGNEDRGASETFPDREAAEAWLGDSWSRLLDEGTESVALEEDGRVLYRMGLREA